MREQNRMPMFVLRQDGHRVVVLVQKLRHFAAEPITHLVSPSLYPDRKKANIGLGPRLRAINKEAMASVL